MEQFKESLERSEKGCSSRNREVKDRKIVATCWREVSAICTSHRRNSSQIIRDAKGKSLETIWTRRKISEFRIEPNSADWWKDDSVLWHGPTWGWQGPGKHRKAHSKLEKPYLVGAMCFFAQRIWWICRSMANNTRAFSDIMYNPKGNNVPRSEKYKTHFSSWRAISELSPTRSLSIHMFAPLC